MKKSNLTIICWFIAQMICSGQHRPSSEPQEEGRSIFTLRPDDPQAVYFTPEKFGIRADGRTDVSAALQEAINEIKTRYNFGILFIPEGTYLINKTIYIPRAIRLIGYGQHRPLIVLGKNAPGFQEPDPADKGQGRYMFWFVSNLSAPGQPVNDAGASTFYSAISNINFRIDEGNPAAVVLRTHFAQHSFISHVDIHTGSGKAGLYDVGNEMEDVRFFGGDYGIYTTKPSPGWQFMMVDTWFEGQRKAAIRTREAGLTIVRMHVRQVPTVIDIDSNYHEKLFMEDCQWDRVSGAAIIISNRDNAMNQVNLRHIDCRDVPVLVRYRLSRESVGGIGPVYRINRFTDGLQMADPQADPGYTTIRDLQPLTSLPAPPQKDIPDFPVMDTWMNLKTLGAKGDGETDDTRVIQEAIDKYPVIYMPQGWYRVSQTIRLKPNTVLIGLNPIATQFQVADNTEAFGGFGSPRPLLETSGGGMNIVSGIGLSTGARNPRAVACKWMAGSGSYMNDVKFIGGHGGMSRPQQLSTPGTAPGSDEWDSQYWSLWITNNGGGTFKDIWTANTYACAGTYISNTATPGRIYAMSVEHHVRNEIRFNKVSNWKVYALQLEEESRESSECQPLELEDCENMVFANLYMFRVIRVIKPYPYSIRQWGGRNLELLNVHNYSQIKYTSTIPLYDINTRTEIRPWEFARLFIPGTGGPAPATTTAPTATPALDGPSARNGTPPSQLLATGFEFAQSPCSDSKGNIYFCESRMRRIYRWSVSTHSISLLADYPWEPLSLACDTKDNLLVVFKYTPQPGYLVNGHPEQFPNPPDAAGTSFSGWGNSGFGTLAYSIDPEAPDETIRPVPRVPMPASRNIFKALYPAHRWRDFHDFNSISVSRPKECFLAPDGVTIIPIEYDLARSTALAEAYPGKPTYASDEYDKRTVKMQVDGEGYLSGLTYFAERGEFSSTTDSRGRVYIADGEIYVYDTAGQQTGMIKVPERPTGIAFGGKDHATLFVTGHRSLYTVGVPGNGSAAAIPAGSTSAATAPVAPASSPASSTSPDPAHSDDRPTLPIGAPAPDFRLPGVDGKTYTQTSFKDARVLVVVFMCNHCPTSQAYEARIIQLKKDYADKGVQVVAISPNHPGSLRLDELGYSDVGDSYEEMKVRAKDAGFNFPYLYDGDTEIASKAYGPVSTPHVFVFDQQRKLRYNGRVDDMEDPKKAPQHPDTRNAIEAVLKGQEVPVAVTKVFGCSIKWAEKSNWIEKAAIAWAKEPVKMDPIDVSGVTELVKNFSNKLRLINIWATWCGPCTAEFPELVTINRMYRDRGFELVSISTDDTASRGKALQFLQNKQSSSPNYIYTGEDKYKLIEAIDPKWQGALPYSMLIEPGGRIVYAHQGDIDPEALKKIIFDDPFMGRIYK